MQAAAEELTPDAAPLRDAKRSSISSLGNALTLAHRTNAANELALPAAFTFRWRDLRVAGQVFENDSGIWLALATELGPVPYTAENSQQREHILGILSLQESLPHGQLKIDTKRQLIHCCEIALATPVTRTAVVSGVVQLLLQTQPYLALAA